MLSWPEQDDEVIHIVKETEPGVWLVHLGFRQTFALYNLLTGGLVLCKLPGLDPHSQTMVTFRMHPNFFLGNNQSILILENHGVVKHLETHPVLEDELDVDALISVSEQRSTPTKKRGNY